ncbi:type II secretion system protein [Candidatus Sumerlaeota bacterium]|nr:type II secretion system protein [Candidatus Sumerlaeota bacterium]
MMIPRNTSPPRRAAAFTLLEVLIAAMIFAITLSALFITFRTGIRAWKSGHSASELYQTARSAQDVIMRDLQSTFYFTEEAYNITYRMQMQQVESFQQARDQAMEMPEDQRDSALQGVQDPRIKAEDLARPVDLSFVGKDGGNLDTLSFTCRQSAWTQREELTWGLRRVKYYVEKGTLYREESSPFGLPGGKTLKDIYEEKIDLALEAQDAGKAHLSKARRDERERLKEDALSVLTDLPTITEPLCEGVEIFNITYGYYRFDQWNEVDTWNSSAFDYRFPQDEMDFTQAISSALGGLPGAAPGGPGRSESGFVPPPSPGGMGEQRLAMINGEATPFQVRPDDLPGYIAIQIGIRDPDSKGRWHSFTFFVSMPKAQEEVDTSQLEDAAQSGFTMPSNSPGRSRRTSLSEERSRGRGR